MLNRFALGPTWFTALSNLGLQAQAIALLQHLGYTGAALPDLLNHYFLTDNPQITTIIDDRALSETSPIRAYTDDNRNYIQWLIDAATQLARHSARGNRLHRKRKSHRPCCTFILRHALLLGYYNSSYNFHRDAGFLSQTELLAMRTEPSFVHIAEAPGTSESRFAALYKTESRITGSPSLLVSDYIRQQLLIAPAAADLAAQIAALKVLVNASTAELERAFRRAHRHLLLPLRRMVAGAGQSTHRCPERGRRPPTREAPAFIWARMPGSKSFIPLPTSLSRSNFRPASQHSFPALRRCCRTRRTAATFTRHRSRTRMPLRFFVPDLSPLRRAAATRANSPSTFLPTGCASPLR